MSKIAEELLKDIESNPDSWANHDGHGIKKGNVIISQYGNSALLSIIDVEINRKEVRALTYMDKYKLEKAITKWYRTVGLRTFQL